MHEKFINIEREAEKVVEYSVFTEEANSGGFVLDSSMNVAFKWQRKFLLNEIATTSLKY